MYSRCIRLTRVCVGAGLHYGGSEGSRRPVAPRGARYGDPTCIQSMTRYAKSKLDARE